MTDFKKLQNGSDIRGVAIETEGGKPVNLTQNSVVRIGAAFALFAADRANKPVSELRIAIGRDSRLSGEQLTLWLADGIASVGANAYDGGLASTPAMFMCCVNELRFDAGIMVTASHLPMERNGMKFFTAIAGGLEKADITAILASAEKAEFPIAAQRGQCGTVDVMTPYVNGLKEKILSALGCAKDEKPFSGLKIVVDAGNGAGGFFAERLLEPLGADITGSRFLEPDGRFPNHQPNPENADAMRSICEAVAETGADFGIIFDTDVDRAGAVLPSDGGVIALDRNRLIALMTAILVRQYGPITVVTDSITSTGLTDFINSLGCRHHRFKRGYRNVINEAKRLLALEEAAKKAKEETDAEFANAIFADAIFADAIFANAIFAMETSGHGALRENYFLDDGAYIIVKLLVALVEARREGKTLNELIANLKEPCESAEARLNVLLDDTADYTAAVLENVEKHFSNLPGFEIVQPNYEGVRVNADETHGNGWFLIRRSLHDPLMPCNIESNSVGGMRLIAAELYNALKVFDKLELEPLKRLM
ncbi:MAG TPA: phosphomannomutase/phosphoglucomutase [Clostridiales bacterium]|nr:phosphomannomutase/phosphoglucomutase [Clostridiales bacterium]